MDLTQLGEQEIGIRMYKAGFGDCFLLSFPGPERRHKMLVDCGSIASHRKSMREIVEQVIADARLGEADGEPRIDIVICTHRHRDHVAGFGNPAWRHVDVGEVWMPWTENPVDPEARRILGAQASLAMGLCARLADPAVTDPEVAKRTFAARADPSETADQLVKLRRKGDKERSKSVRQSLIALNALSNPEAMATLHSGFKGSPTRYFLPETPQTVAPSTGEGGSSPRERSFTTSALPNAEVHVMGPSRDEEIIRLMDPPDGKSYFRAAPVAGHEVAPSRPPFGKQWQVDEADLAGVLAGFRVALRPQDIERLRTLDSDDPALLAASLDGAVNGTSLMFMVSFRGINLFFPGDAQWGTWNRAMQDPQWRELMSRTHFYKVGHHGSHNANPKEFVEQLLPGNGQSIAMVSVRPHGRWPEIPREPLLAALGKRSRTVRADADPATVAAPFTSEGDFHIDTVLTF